MKPNKIMPCLWFRTEDGKISEVIEYYTKIFGNEFEPGGIIPIGDTPSGYTELCEVKIFGQKYTLMSTALEHQRFTDALSFILLCEDQNEIDKFWDYFTREGEESQCGWCIDKYGFRWQVQPANMNELMNRPNAMEVMLKQKKIIIKEYFA